MNTTGLIGKSGLAVLLLALAACGGKGGGGAAAPQSAPAGEFTKTVTLDGTVVNFIGPFRAGTDTNSRYQHLVLAKDLNGAGWLRRIAFRYFAPGSSNGRCDGVTLRFGHTGLGALTTTFANNVDQGRGPVHTGLDDAPISFPSALGGAYLPITLARPFYYNGVDNLVVEVVTRGCHDMPQFQAQSAASPYTAAVWSSNPAATTGSASNYLHHLRLDFAGGDDRVVYGGTAINAGTPFTDTPGAARDVQMLYHRSRIDGAGAITGIAFPVAIATSAPAEFEVTVKLGHSTRDDLAGHRLGHDNFSAAPMTVADHATLRVPAGKPVGGLVWLPFTDGPFPYNGVDNLIVWVVVHAASGNLAIRADDTGAHQTTSDSFVGDGTHDWAYHAVLRFRGGHLDVHTPGAIGGGTVDSFPLQSTQGKRQYLYLASELGSRGRITHLACRASANAVADGGYDYRIVLSHTNATALGTDFAANLSTPVTVYNGGLSRPAVRRGDWIEFPLSSGFDYNGRDNLVVQIAGSGGTAGLAGCLVDADAVLYAGRRLFGVNEAATTGAASSHLPDMRFFLP